MTVLKMAVRNLGRNTRRTALAATSLFIALLLVVFLAGFTRGFLDSIVRNSTKNDTGHLNVATTAFRARERFMPVSEYVEDSAALAAALASVKTEGVAVTRVAERIRFGVVVANGERSKFAMGIAGDPEVERSMLMLDRSVVEGSCLAGPGDMLIGARLAEALGYRVGDEVRLVTEKADFGLGFKKFRIAGVFRTGVNSLDGTVFQVSLEDARALLGMEGGAQQVLVMLDDYRKADLAADAIRAELGSRGFEGLSVLPWTGQGEWPRMVRMMEDIYGGMFLVVGFLGAFIVANVVMMAVLERRREIGILKSMGMRSSSVFWLFLAEGAMIGAIGGGLGSVAGVGLNALMGAIGLDMTAAMAGFSWPMDNVVYPTVEPLAALWGLGIGVLTAAIVSALPALKAARLEAVDAIKGVA